MRKGDLNNVIFGVTIDISHQSQLSLVINNETKGMIRDDFVGFSDTRQQNADPDSEEYLPESSGIFSEVLYCSL